MAAETGTYHWMAPEAFLTYFTFFAYSSLLPQMWVHFQVIENKPYDTKADIFNFRIVLWKLLTGSLTSCSRRRSKGTLIFQVPYKLLQKTFKRTTIIRHNATFDFGTILDFQELKQNKFLQ